MKKSLLTFVTAAGIAFAAGNTQTFTGVITETMCGTKHTMGITPEPKCVRECVKSDPKKYKYALQAGDKLYVLSDQQTPEQFAAEKVKVTGTLFEKTGIIKADKIQRTK
jgi:hypothetical protein